MAFIEDHRLHIFEWVVVVVGLRIQHVAEDLGGHHHDLGFAVEAQVTGEQAHLFGAKLRTKIPQLLVGEGLEGGCVEDLLTMGQGPIDRVLPHQGFTGSRGGTHHHRMPLIEGIDRLQLESIQREGEEGLQH